MNTSITTKIRRATIDDYGVLCGLFRKLDALHVDLLPENFRAFDGPVRTVELFREKISSEDKELFVALIGTQIAGFVDVQQSSNPPAPMFVPRKFALIDNLYVTPEFRGTGLAHTLLDQAKMWATEQGFSHLQLKVYNKNEGAIRFYQKEGLIPVSTTFEMEL